MPSATAHRVLLLAAAFLFSTGGAAIKATSLSGLQVAAFRSGLAALALMLAMRGWRQTLSRRVWLVGAAYAATMILYVNANKLTTAANTIFLQSTAPMYVLLLGPWLLRERLRRGDLAFTATLALGLVLFFLGMEPPLATAPNPFLGNVLAAIAGVTWAATILGLRWLGRSGSPGNPAGTAVIAGNLVACAACLPFALPVTGSGRADWIIIGYLGLFQIGLAYVFLTRAIRHVPALDAALLLLLEPVLNALLAWWVHGERPRSWALAGCSIVLVATLFRTLRRRSPARESRSTCPG